MGAIGAICGIVGGISSWEMNRFMLELDRQIDHTPGSLMV